MIRCLKIIILQILIQNPGLTLHAIKQKIELEWRLDKKQFGLQMRNAAHSLKHCSIPPYDENDLKVVVMNNRRYYIHPEVEISHVTAYCLRQAALFEVEMRRMIEYAHAVLHASIQNMSGTQTGLVHFPETFEHTSINNLDLTSLAEIVLWFRRYQDEHNVIITELENNEDGGGDDDDDVDDDDDDIGNNNVEPLTDFPVVSVHHLSQNICTHQELIASRVPNAYFLANTFLSKIWPYIDILLVKLKKGFGLM